LLNGKIMQQQPSQEELLYVVQETVEKQFQELPV